jgi:hypothetical protein
MLEVVTAIADVSQSLGPDRPEGKVTVSIFRDGSGTRLEVQSSSETA